MTRNPAVLDRRIETLVNRLRRELEGLEGVQRGRIVRATMPAEVEVEAIEGCPF
jgi:hypothetical protein